MNADALPAFELLGPLIFVIGAIYVLSPMLPLSRPWARILVFATVWLFIARYLDWRLFTTVMPVTGEWYQGCGSASSSRYSPCSMRLFSTSLSCERATVTARPTPIRQDFVPCRRKTCLG